MKASLFCLLISFVCAAKKASWESAYFCQWLFILLGLIAIWLEWKK